MTRFLFARQQAFICLAWLLSAGSWAESPDPLDAQATTPPVHYQSPLKGYQGFSEQPQYDWREANDLVGRIGGWRTYSQEPYAQEPGTQRAPAQQPAEPSTKPMELHHGHH
ncbi:MAG: hypothetical protein KJ884_16555 [Gammaproteobacteria bacterium]|nr:hypothetical protein [Gammaproteobacteria bacterium]MBU1492033.1 hypothetical protein [Gammaproteobacteria bacterium]MBU2065939.1 hypothetical protein [Gammaproteobacteria bacterium]MBU2141265.1 hypothetical protein [Gammaproteobacteria bacterium]MBU2215365.1 hypothetical protein [Gammaproteobacteria bacterium]